MLKLLLLFKLVFTEIKTANFEALGPSRPIEVMPGFPNTRGRTRQLTIRAVTMNKSNFNVSIQVLLWAQYFERLAQIWYFSLKFVSYFRSFLTIPYDVRFIEDDFIPFSAILFLLCPILRILKEEKCSIPGEQKTEKV